jgi:N-acylneuraminate cytidylyltransferase
MRVAVIPARGGSKRIVGKNIRPFCGRPIIEYSIAAARSSGCFDRIIVSTDDDAIADVARAAGAEVPFTRPAELSDDHTATIPVVAHAIEWLAEADQHPDLVCCIYATAPFLRADEILLGLKMLRESRCDYCFTATGFAAPIQRAFRIDADGRVEMFSPAHFNTRSQDLEPAYHDAAQFYWGTAAAWLDARPVFSPSSVPLVLPRHRVQDIDSEEDWVRAEAMFMALRETKPL